MDCLVKLFKALSDPTRLRIVYLLLNAGGELCICEILEAIKIPQYNVSKHMKELKNAGLAKERKEGRFVYYSLAECCGGFTGKIFKTLKTADNQVFIKDLKHLKKKFPDRTCRNCA